MKIAIGGFGGQGVPNLLADTVLSSKNGGHTLIVNDIGPDGGVLSRLVLSGKCSKVICSFVGQNKEIQNLVSTGIFEIVPQGQLVFALMAGAYGIDYFVDGGEKVFPIIPDLALCCGKFSDKYGNIFFEGTDKNFNPVMAKAAKKTVFEVEDIKNIETSKRMLSGAFVDYVVVSEK